MTSGREYAVRGQGCDVRDARELRDDVRAAARRARLGGHQRAVRPGNQFGVARVGDFLLTLEQRVPVRREVHLRVLVPQVRVNVGIRQESAQRVPVVPLAQPQTTSRRRGASGARFGSAKTRRRAGAARGARRLRRRTGGMAAVLNVGWKNAETVPRRANARRASSAARARLKRLPLRKRAGSPGSARARRSVEDSHPSGPIASTRRASSPPRPASCRSGARAGRRRTRADPPSVPGKPLASSTAGTRPRLPRVAHLISAPRRARNNGDPASSAARDPSLADPAPWTRTRRRRPRAPRPARARARRRPRGATGKTSRSRPGSSRLRRSPRGTRRMRPPRVPPAAAPPGASPRGSRRGTRLCPARPAPRRSCRRARRARGSAGTPCRRPPGGTAGPRRC